VNGVLSKLNRGLDLELEAGLQLTPRFSLTVGIGYLSTREQDTIAYDWSAAGTTFHDTLEIRPHLTAVPLLLSLQYSLPLGPVRMNLAAGPGLYFCRFAYRTDFSSTQADWSYGYSFIAHRVVPAFQARLGAEVPLGHRLSILLDVLGRYARVSEIRGRGTVSGTLAGSPYSAELAGQEFWYTEYVLDDASYPQTVFQAYEPYSHLLANTRPGRFDFTGIALRLGIKVSI
jgi:hypothetical protein